MDFFGRYLSVWVALAIVAGVALGQLRRQYQRRCLASNIAQVSIPIAILIWAIFSR